MKSNFSTAANSFARILFYVYWILSLNQFIGIISLHNLLMLFKATSVYHSSSCPLSPSRETQDPKPRSGGFAPWTTFNFGACSAGYLIQKRTVRGKRKGPFYFSAIFSFGYFFLSLFFPAIFFRYPLEEGGGYLVRVLQDNVIAGRRKSCTRDERTNDGSSIAR